VYMCRGPIHIYCLEHIKKRIHDIEWWRWAVFRFGHSIYDIRPNM